MSLLARISVWTVTKRGHLLALLLSSWFTFPNPEEAVLEIKPTQYPGAVAAVGQVLALVLIPGGPRRSWQHPESLSKRQRVTYCFAPPASLGWETSPSLTWAMGYSSEEGRARKVWIFVPRVSVVQGRLWTACCASRTGQGQCNTTIQVHHALRGEAKKMLPRDHWANIILEGLS